jgi:hypothetical protein
MRELDGVLPADERACLCEAYGFLEARDRDLGLSAGDVVTFDGGGRRVSDGADFL